MNQFFNAQKQKHKMTHLPWGDLVFPPPLICFHQKPRGGKRKWMGHLCSCDVIWCDWSQWDGVFEGSPHRANTSSSSARAVSSSRPARKGGGQRSNKSLGALAKSWKRLWLSYISLLTSICSGGSYPRCYITKHPRFDSCVWFLDKSLTFYSFINSHSDYLLSTFCVPDIVLGAGLWRWAKADPNGLLVG